MESGLLIVLVVGGSIYLAYRYFLKSILDPVGDPVLDTFFSPEEQAEMARTKQEGLAKYQLHQAEAKQKEAELQHALNYARQKLAEEMAHEILVKKVDQEDAEADFEEKYEAVKTVQAGFHGRRAVQRMSYDLGFDRSWL